MPFARRKLKNVKEKGGAQKTTTAPQKKSLFGEPWRGRWALVLGGFLPPEPPEFEKNIVFTTFPVDPGGSPGGRTLARAVMHF